MQVIVLQLQTENIIRQFHYGESAVLTYCFHFLPKITHNYILFNAIYKAAFDLAVEGEGLSGGLMAILNSLLSSQHVIGRLEEETCEP